MAPRPIAATLSTGSKGDGGMVESILAIGTGHRLSWSAGGIAELRARRSVSGNSTSVATTPWSRRRETASSDDRRSGQTRTTPAKRAQIKVRQRRAQVLGGSGVAVLDRALLHHQWKKSSLDDLVNRNNTALAALSQRRTAPAEDSWAMT